MTTHKTSLMQRIRYGLAALALVLIPTVSIAMASSALAASPKDEVCKGLGASGGGASCSAGSGPTVMEVIRAVIRILALVVGVAAIIMVVVAGMKYITSGGDPSSVKSAKDTLVYAIIGLMVAALAQGLVQFVLVKVQ